jgi:hypothetical protein
MHLIVQKKDEKANVEERNKVPLRVQSTFITLVCTLMIEKKETFAIAFKSIHSFLSLCI